MGESLEWDQRKSLGVVMAAKGYPHKYEKNNEIRNIPEETMNLKISCWDKTKRRIFKTNGGRVLCVTALGDSVQSAQAKVYSEIENILWDDGFFRRDIGYRAIARGRKMSLVDQIISEIDKGLKFSLDNYQKESRAYPAEEIEEDNLSELDRSHSANLMRVNHSGEVAAQGLYRGQALTVKT